MSHENQKLNSQQSRQPEERTPRKQEPGTQPGNSDSNSQRNQKPASAPKNNSRSNGNRVPNPPPRRLATENEANQSTLMAYTRKKIMALAMAVGNFLREVADIAATDTAARQKGERAKCMRERQSANDRKAAAQARFEKARHQESQQPPRIAEGRTRQPGIIDRFVDLLMVLTLFGVLFVENGAAAQLLQSIAALGVTDLATARTIMITPIGIGFAFVLAKRLMPWRLQRRIVLVASAILVTSFSIWVYDFASQVGQAEVAANAGFSESGEEGTPPWLMFGAMVAMMATSSFLGHAGLESFSGRLNNWVTNAAHQQAVDDMMAAELEIKTIDKELAEIDRRMEVLADEKKQAVATAIALYKSIKHAANFLLMATIVLTLIGCSSPNGSSNGPFKAASSQSGVSPEHRVIAISPNLPETEFKAVNQSLNQSYDWLLRNAAIGSTLIIVDAWEGAVIARLEAVAGVPRIRKQAMAHGVESVRSYLKQTNHGKDDGRVHLPRLVQTIAQLSPTPADVAVLGQPLFVAESGGDGYFSMLDGRYPTDGWLFQPPNESLFSVVGRERLLKGQFYHFGWHNNRAFADDNHRQAVLRFWHLYLKEQGGLLVTAQQSLPSAVTSSGLRNPLMHGVARRDEKPAMVSVVFDPNDNDDQKIIRKSRDNVNIRRNVSQERKKKERTNVSIKRTGGHSTQNESRDDDVEVRQRDKWGNRVGSSADLIDDGQMLGKNILMVRLFNDENVRQSPLCATLREKGYTVSIMEGPLPSAGKFANRLNMMDQVWLFSSRESQAMPSQHVRLLADRYRNGKLSICCLAENSPFTAQATALFRELAPGATISGDYKGEQLLHRRNRNQPGFVEHPVFHNIETLWEGTTIANMKGGGLQPVCFASNGQPLIATLENGQSRFVVHGGWTSFYKQFWQDAGVKRLAVNVAGWLSGVSNGKQLASVAADSRH